MEGSDFLVNLLAGLAGGGVGGGGTAAVFRQFMKRSNERLKLLEKKTGEQADKIQHLLTWEKAQNGALSRIETAVNRILDKLDR